MSDTETTEVKKSKRSEKPNVAKPKAEKVEKPKVEKPEKNHGFKVPPKNGRNKSIRWCYHVYHMIEEAAPTLLQDENVKNAYNNVIDCCMKYEGRLDTWIPAKYHKYTHGIKLENSSGYGYGYFKGMPLRFNNEYDAYNNANLKQEFKTISEEILKTYNVLYDLIKRNVVNYMEIKAHEEKGKKDIEYYHRTMEKLERDIKAYEQAIETARRSISEYAKKCVALQGSPVLTKFD